MTPWGKGFLATLPYPGARAPADVTIKALAAEGVRQVVSLLQPGEIESLEPEGEARLVTAASMQFVSFPIADMSVPDSVDEFAVLCWRLFRQIRAGQNTAIHCRGGIGRSGLLAAAILLHRGLEVTPAFAQVALARAAAVPETGAQGRWLKSNADKIRAVATAAKA